MLKRILQAFKKSSGTSYSTSRRTMLSAWPGISLSVGVLTRDAGAQVSEITSRPSLGMKSAEGEERGSGRSALATINITEAPYNAKCDGVADETIILQKALDDLPVYGGSIFIPRLIRTTSPLVVKRPNTMLISTAKRDWAYSLPVPRDVFNGPGGVFSDHAGNCIELRSRFKPNGFVLARCSLFGISAVNGSVGVAFICDANNFCRNVSIDDAAIVRFNDALKVTVERTSESAWGAIRVINSNIIHNGYIARMAGGSQINHLLFLGNDTTNQLTGGLHVDAHSATIIGNLMEGTPNTVLVNGAFRGLTIKGNYFEANTGKACIDLRNCSEFDIGPNTYLDIAAGRKVELSGVGQGTCLDPYSGWGIHKVAYPVAVAKGPRAHNVPAQGSAQFGWAGEPVFGASFEYVQSRSLALREAVALNGQQCFVHRSQSRSGSSDPIVQVVPVVAAPGQFLSVQFLLRLNEPEALGDLCLGLSLNGSGAAGSYENPFWNSVAFLRDREWVHVVAAVRADVQVTSMKVNLWPYGKSPKVTRSLSADVSPVQAQVTRSLDEVRPGYTLMSGVVIDDDFIGQLGRDDRAKWAGWTISGGVGHVRPYSVGRPGQLSLSSIANASDAALLTSERVGNQFLNQFRNDEWQEVQIHLALQDLASDYLLRFGLASSPHDPNPGNAIMFERQSGSAGISAVVQSTQSQSRVQFQLNDTNYHRFVLKRTSSGIQCLIDDGIPTLLNDEVISSSAVVAPFIAIKPSNPSVRTVAVDRLKITFYPVLR